MSNSMFDPEVEVTLAKSNVGALSVTRTELKVKGDLDEEVETNARYLRVLVSVWQTEEDTKAGGSPQVLIAHALGVGERTERGRWSAEIELVDGESFKSGSVSGLAHAVGSDGVPGGFETYTWTGRLRIENP